jgi:hypothetical protein
LFEQWVAFVRTIIKFAIIRTIDQKMITVIDCPPYIPYIDHMDDSASSSTSEYSSEFFSRLISVPVRRSDLLVTKSGSPPRIDIASCKSSQGPKYQTLDRTPGRKSLFFRRRNCGRNRRPNSRTRTPSHGRRLACLFRKSVALKSDHIRG